LKFYLDNTKKELAGQSSSNEELLAQLASLTMQRDAITKERDDGQDMLMKLALEFHAYKIEVENRNESNGASESAVDTRVTPPPLPSPFPPGEDINKGTPRKGWFR
jgi:hypothetical protein